MITSIAVDVKECVDARFGLQRAHIDNSVLQPAVHPSCPEAIVSDIIKNLQVTSKPEFYPIGISFEPVKTWTQNQTQTLRFMR